MVAPGPPASRTDDDQDVERLREALAEEHDRALRAGEDARRAERETLKTRQELHRVQGQLRELRERHREMAGRQSLRLADRVLRRRAWLSRGARNALRGVLGVGRSGRTPSPAEPPIDRQPRVVASADADPRQLPGHYRATLLAALQGAQGATPLHVAISDGPLAGRIAEGLTAAGHRAVIVPTPTAEQPPAADVDVLVITDPSIDLTVLPPGPIRVLWTAAADGAASGGQGPADGHRSEADLVLLAEPGDAGAFAAALEGWLRSVRVGIRAPSGSARKAANWGDTYFARDLRAAFRAAGHPARLHYHDRWDDPAVGRDDVIVDLLGVYEPTSFVGAARVLWQISHPELASPSLYARYDRVFVASEPFAALMAEGVEGVPIEVLHQATDVARFKPGTGDPRHEVLIVANWRPGRRIVADLLPTTHEIMVHGRDWPAEELPPGMTTAVPIPNADLPAAYAGTAILANDHAPGMRREGFPSNRLFDGAAAGALVISDRVDGVDGLFDGGIPCYRDGVELRSLVDRYLADDALRRSTAERARAAVFARHTFAHRARTILDAAAPFVARAADLAR